MNYPISPRLDASDLARLNNYAKVVKMSRNKIVELAIKEFLDNRLPPNRLEELEGLFREVRDELKEQNDTASIAGFVSRAAVSAGVTLEELKWMGVPETLKPKPETDHWEAIGKEFERLAEHTPRNPDRS